MIRYNLNKLLGERNLKISKVFVDTGISRSTLTKIVNNQSSMVQTETIFLSLHNLTFESSKK